MDQSNNRQRSQRPNSTLTEQERREARERRARERAARRAAEEAAVNDTVARDEFGEAEYLSEDVDTFTDNQPVAYDNQPVEYNNQPVEYDDQPIEYDGQPIEYLDDELVDYNDQSSEYLDDELVDYNDQFGEYDEYYDDELSENTSDVYEEVSHKGFETYDSPTSSSLAERTRRLNERSRRTNGTGRANGTNRANRISGSNGPSQEFPLSSVLIGAGVVLLGLLLAIWLLSSLLRGCSGPADSTAPVVSATEASQSSTEGQAEGQTDGQTDGQTTSSETTTTSSQVPTKSLNLGTTSTSSNRFSLVAAGDNVIGNYLLQMGDREGGSADDGVYDFSGLYSNIKSFVSKFDAALINQETVLGGSSFDYAGYPVYNTPDAIADAISKAGFNVVNINSNHLFDMGKEGVEQAQKTWASYSDLLTIGSYESQTDRETVRVVEANGIKVAFLSYCYGQDAATDTDSSSSNESSSTSSSSSSSKSNDYYTADFDEDAIKDDVARAKKAADAVVVYMHWGTEYEGEVTSQQRHFAQLCADEGVDVVIGSNAHVVQPIEWITATGGKKMLCAYGIGDFITAGAFGTDGLASGMLSLEFVREPGGSDVTVQKVVWHPIVEHWENESDTVYLMKDYTESMAANNVLLGGNGTDALYELSVARVGSDVEIDMAVETVSDETTYDTDDETSDESSEEDSESSSEESEASYDSETSEATDTEQTSAEESEAN